MYEIHRQNADYLKLLENKHYEQTIYTTYPWVMFLVKNQKAEPVILEILDQGELVSVFVGLIITKFGIRILGSPFEEWFTEEMGFIEIRNCDYGECIQAVKEYAFKHLKCLFIQITDNKIRLKDIPKDIDYSINKSLILDLRPSETEIFSSFRKDARKNIRRFEKKGAVLKEVVFDNNFAVTFYDQIKDVFEKQGLQPNYNLQKIKDMVEAFKDNQDKILAMQVYDPDNICIASAIYLLYGDWCYSLATASYREYQHYLPNEIIRWHGIQYCKNKGSKFFNFCGYREYKLKYAPQIVDIPTIIIYRYKILVYFKEAARQTIIKYRYLKGIIKSDK